MPYIPPENAGELNYKICMIVLDYLNYKGIRHEDFKKGFNGTIWPKLENAEKE